MDQQFLVFAKNHVSHLLAQLFFYILMNSLFDVVVFLALYLGTIAKLWSILKRLIFKQCLICIGLSFKNDGFNKNYIF